jgi:hypothetical protein
VVTRSRRAEPCRTSANNYDVIPYGVHALLSFLAFCTFAASVPGAVTSASTASGIAGKLICQSGKMMEW